LGDLPQRDPLAAAGDHDRDARLLHRRSWPLGPDPPRGRDRLVERALPVAQRRERQPLGGELLLDPADPQPEHEPPAADPAAAGGDPGVGLVELLHRNQDTLDLRRTRTGAVSVDGGGSSERGPLARRAASRRVGGPWRAAAGGRAVLTRPPARRSPTAAWTI